MSYAQFADGESAIDLTGVEVRNIGHLAEQALEHALAEPEALELCDRLAWKPGASTLNGRRIVERLDNGLMIGARGPWHLFDVGANTFAQSHPSAIALTRLFASDRGWVEGDDRSWLADHYQALLDVGITRPLMGGAHQEPLKIGHHVLPPPSDAGWEEVIAWLRSGDQPVVTHLSVNEHYFPDEDLAVQAGLREPEDADVDERRWNHELDAGERWELGIRALRALEDTHRRQWNRENFALPRLTVELLIQHVADVRLVQHIY